MLSHIRCHILAQTNLIIMYIIMEAYWIIDSSFDTLYI